MSAAPKDHASLKAKLAADLRAYEQARKDLALIEEYERMMERRQGKKGTNGSKSFAELKKPDAVDYLLREAGKPLQQEALFDDMKKRGHPVASLNSLRTMLATDARFVRLRDRSWWFAHEEVPSP